MNLFFLKKSFLFDRLLYSNRLYVILERKFYMRKIILFGVQFIVLSNHSIAMEDPINNGIQRRHIGKMLSSSNLPNKPVTSLNPAEENFILGLKCLREKKFTIN